MGSDTGAKVTQVASPAHARRGETHTLRGSVRTPASQVCDLEASNIDHTRHSVHDTTGDQATQGGQRPNQVETHVQFSDPVSEGVPRMLGDFDGSSNELWTLFINETKNHDDARINTLKDDMASSLIFAGLFSATLTTFVNNTEQNLTPSTPNRTELLLGQISEQLYQISVQLSTITSQAPPSPPTPTDTVSSSPSPSDIRINVFLFMSLAFSLIAALLAILVQQWVRDYMHVFKRGDPLKSARLRQYLYEGCEGWYMPMVAEVVPGVLHFSLFLFFAGLVNSLLQINTTVALSIMIPFSICGLLYIVMMFAPIRYPQSPYQNSFTGIFWYLYQNSRGRLFKDRGPDGEMSTDMAQGQMQLAMEATEERMDRDVRAIQWLIINLTADAEMEKFLAAIPGSFNTKWGTEAWKRVSEHQSYDGPVVRSHRDATAHPLSSSWSIGGVFRSIIHLVRRLAHLHHPTHPTTQSPVPHPPNDHPPSTIPHIQGEGVVYDLSKRIARSVDICKNHKLFTNNDDLYQKRTRACIEATASLVCCANAELDWFGDISKLVGDFGRSEKIRERSLAGTDQLFVMRWTCLSLVAIRPILKDKRVRERVTQAIELFDAGNNDALAGVQKVDGSIGKAIECLDQLYNTLRRTEDLALTEEITEVLRGHESESQISKLEKINTDADQLEWVDSSIFDMQDAINVKSHNIASQIPGALDDFDQSYQTAIPFDRFVELSRDPRKLQFICPGQILKSISSPSLSLRGILKGNGGAEAYKKLLKNLEDFPFSSWHGNVMQRQFWRLQDLHGGGFGFTVELFFLSLSQPSSASPSEESHSALYTGTFQAITSDWSEHKGSIGTQMLLLDIAISRREEFRVHYPPYIVKEFLSLLDNIFKGQTGTHIGQARQQFESFGFHDPRNLGFREKVLMALTSGQAQSPESLH